MADALASGASVRKDVGVQVPPRPPVVGVLIRVLVRIFERRGQDPAPDPQSRSDAMGMALNSPGSLSNPTAPRTTMATASPVRVPVRSSSTRKGRDSSIEPACVTTWSISSGRLPNRCAVTTTNPSKPRAEPDTERIPGGRTLRDCGASIVMVELMAPITDHWSAGPSCRISGGSSRGK